MSTSWKLGLLALFVAVPAMAGYALAIVALFFAALGIGGFFRWLFA